MLENNHITVAIDAMGGDLGPGVVVPAAIKSVEQYPDLSIMLVGQQDNLTDFLAKHKNSSALDRIKIKHASQVVSMQDMPAFALRNKKDSSMRIALNLVHENAAQACVSSGNTGALMATARYVLKTLTGVDRPAIISPIPTANGVVHMLDLGANVECHSEHLFQFAVMGSILVSAVLGKTKPRVGLLNIGAESIKGTDAVKRAAELLEASDSINYIGFVEGDSIFKGVADVVVCDGFAGNVALKSSEGLAKMIMEFAKREFSSSLLTKLLGLLCKSTFKKIFEHINPAKYNGGNLLGLRGVVVKSHGSANEEAFVSAIKVAMLAAKQNVPDKISEQVANLLQEPY